MLTRDLLALTSLVYVDLRRACAHVLIFAGAGPTGIVSEMFHSFWKLCLVTSVSNENAVCCRGLHEQLKV